MATCDRIAGEILSSGNVTFRPVLAQSPNSKYVRGYTPLPNMRLKKVNIVQIFEKHQISQTTKMIAESEGKAILYT